MKRENRSRAFRARITLHQYALKLHGAGQLEHEPSKGIVADLLTDLMHLCEQGVTRGEGPVDFSEALRIAKQHYIAEGGSQ
jgi:hypothetical protein